MATTPARNPDRQAAEEADDQAPPTGPSGLIGRPAPDFVLKSNRMDEVSLSDFRGSPVLLVFMPLAFSPLCQDEYCALQDHLEELQNLQAKVVGVSVDSQWSLKAWSAQQSYRFPILSDFHPKGRVARMYGVYAEDSGTARRVTFLIDRGGSVAQVVAMSDFDAVRSIEDYVAALQNIVGERQW